MGVFRGALEFIYPQDFRRLEHYRIFEAYYIVVEDMADGLVIDSHLPRQLRKGLGETMAFDVSHQAGGGQPFAIHGRQRLE